MCQHALTPEDTRAHAAQNCAPVELQGMVMRSEQHLLTKVHIQGRGCCSNVLRSHILQRRVADAASVPHKQHPHLHSSRLSWASGGWFQSFGNTQTI